MLLPKNCNWEAYGKRGGHSIAEVEFAKELAKQLPVARIYGDAVSPAATQTGQLLEDLVKVVRLATFPIQALAALQDRYRRFLETSVGDVAGASTCPAPVTDRTPPRRAAWL